ncbi:hypothetical protein CFC21_104018 [Triticum aestivum]|uniref:Uncharacterized protein n=2 Tax=Triticum aestivum TaxID=4565 RepID=A0A3B6SJ59_WHEAT|nr:hypothetical protein CFC21_104018 [Triticum aestivum]
MGTSIFLVVVGKKLQNDFLFVHAQKRMNLQWTAYVAGWPDRSADPRGIYCGKRWMDNQMGACIKSQLIRHIHGGADVLILMDVLRPKPAATKRFGLLQKAEIYGIQIEISERIVEIMLVEIDSFRPETCPLVSSEFMKMKQQQYTYVVFFCR